jgi:hypothetical protein
MTYLVPAYPHQTSLSAEGSFVRKKCHQSLFVRGPQSCDKKDIIQKILSNVLRKSDFETIFATMRVPFWKRRSAMTSEFPADPPKKRNCHLPKGMKQVVYENKIHCVTKDNP